MKRITRRTLLATGSAASVSLPFLNLRPAAAAEFTFKYGGIVPTDHPLTQGVAKAADAIKEKSGGRLEIKIFPNSQLGSEMDMLSQLRSGALEFLTTSGLELASLVPGASISGVGFAFNDFAEVWQALDGKLGAHMREQIGKANLVVFDRIWNSGFRQIMTTSKPINAPADLKGFKLRVPSSPMWISLYRALEAAPVSINWGDTYTALQTRIVDGVDASLVSFNTAKLYEVQKTCSLTNHMWDGYWMLANRRVFERLPADLRDLVAAEFNSAALWQRAEIERQTANMQARLTSLGMGFGKPDIPAFQDALRRAGYYAEQRSKFGEDAWALLESSVGKKMG